MKVRLRSDERGMPRVETETGEPIKYVTSAMIDMGFREVSATITLANPDIDITCDARIKETRQLIYDQNDLESIAAAMAILVKRRNDLERL